MRLIRFDGKSLEVVAFENLLQEALMMQGSADPRAKDKTRQPQQPHSGIITEHHHENRE